jgi:hypothetical protein
LARVLCSDATKRSTRERFVTTHQGPLSASASHRSLHNYAEFHDNPHGDSFRLIACRNDDGYKDGVIQIDGNEYAYYDNSRDHVFFLGTDWDEAIDQVWILDKWQEPAGVKFYDLNARQPQRRRTL